MDKEDVVHIHNGILFGYKKEWNLPCVETWMDLQTAIEREKQIPYNIAYVWNLEKLYRWTYLQSRNRDTDLEYKCMDTKGEGGMGWIARLGLTYIHYSI